MSIMQMLFVSSSALGVSAPNELSRAGVRGDTLSGTVTATPTQAGGTYSWAFVSGGLSLNLTNTTSATVTVSSSTSTGTVDVQRTGVLRCTYTLGGNSVFADVNVNFSWTGSAF